MEATGLGHNVKLVVKHQIKYG